MFKNWSGMDFLQEKVTPAVTKFCNLKFIACMQSGIVACMNATMIGSIFMLLMNPPFPADSTFAFAQAWHTFAIANEQWLNLGYQLGLNAAGFYILIGMVVAVCQRENMKVTNNLVLSIFSFIVLQCNFIPNGGLDIGFWGAKGMMAALLIGYAVPEMNKWFIDHGFKIKLPDSVPPFVAEPINQIFSSILVVNNIYNKIKFRLLWFHCRKLNKWYLCTYFPSK